MTAAQLKKWQRRFRELAVQEALQPTTDREKLDRIQALLRPKRTMQEIVREAQTNYVIRQASKEIEKYRRVGLNQSKLKQFVEGMV